MNISNRKREEIYGTSSVNDDKNVPEQKAMTVDNAGYEEAFEDVQQAQCRISFRSGKEPTKKEH